MNSVAKTIDGTDGKGGVWSITDQDSGENLGEVDISHNPDGSRNVEYAVKDKAPVSGTVPSSDTRNDDQLAKDVVFTNGSMKEPAFRPAP